MDHILDLLQERKDAGSVAFKMPEGDGVITYRQYAAWVDLISVALKDAGLVGSQRVAVAMPRDPLGLALFLGVSRDNICCPMNASLRREEVGRFLESTGAQFFIAPAKNVEALAEAATHGISAISIVASRPGELQLKKLTYEKPSPPTPEAAAGRYALLLQTSGTTSKPKVVLLQHKQIMATVSGIVSEFGLGPDDLCLNPMPFQHAHGLLTAGLSSLAAGSSAVCLPSFSAETFLAAFETHSPTWFTGAPAMHIALLEYITKSGRTPHNSNLRFFRSSSAPLPSAIISDLEKVFNAPLIETYGLTETASMIATNPLPPKARKVGSVGLPCAGAEIKIRWSGKVAAPSGTEGEILVKGPSVIKHYGERYAEDLENFDGEWFCTGDIGRIDHDGYLFISGRTKELIKRGGMSVYPTEVDNELMAFPEIVDAATFSVTHPTLGEDVVSAVVMAKGCSFDESKIREHLLSRLSSYKVPSALVEVKSVKKGDTGKIARRDMAKWFQETLVPASVKPEGQLETLILSRWIEVLDRHDIGVTDNLFLFGADPLRADKFRELILKDGLKVERGFPFKYPSVRTQAAQARL